MPDIRASLVRDLLLPFYKGDPGAPGVQGAQGAPGPAGPAGSDGAPGAPGPQGPQGVAGPQGPAGPAGADGAPGAQGVAGPQGVPGPAGAAGAQGPVGPAGAQGVPGPQGPVGPAGADGNDGAPGQDFTPAPLNLWDEWTQQFFHNSSSPAGPFNTISISSGNFSNTGGLVAVQDGYWLDGILYTSSATANSGIRTLTTQGCVMFGSKALIFQAAWRPITALNTLVRLGFHDTSTTTSPADGAWFDIIDGVAVGRTNNNGAGSSTATSYPLTMGLVYVFEVLVNAAATLATFTIRDGITGEVLWTDSLDTTLPPKLTSRATGAGIIATCSNTVGTQLGAIYMMGLGTPAGYARARG